MDSAMDDPRRMVETMLLIAFERAMQVALAGPGKVAPGYYVIN